MSDSQQEPTTQPPAKTSRGWMWIAVAATMVAVVAVVIASNRGGKTPTTDSTAGTDPTTSIDTAVTATTGVGSDNSETSPPEGDVDLKGCGVDSSGQLKATIAVVNSSSKSSDFVISVLFQATDGETLIDTATATVNGLPPNQSSTADAVSGKPDPPADALCTIEKVSRRDHIS